MLHPSSPAATPSPQQRLGPLEPCLALALGLVCFAGAVAAQTQPSLSRVEAGGRPVIAPDGGNPFATNDLAPALDAAGLERALLGSVPRGEVTPGSMPLSLRETVERALELNLGVRLRQEAAEAARGGMIAARADRLPQLTAEIADRRLEFNFDASAFSGFGGEERTDPVVDYELFDARLLLRAPLFDATARWDARAAAERYAAAAIAAGEIRAAVVLFVGNLYLRVTAQQVRLESIEAQVETAEALLELARDAVESGLAPAIDAVRAEVRLRSEQQRLVAERNELAKSKLRLARTIGLAPAQEFHITEVLGYVPIPELDVEELVAEGLRVRPDLRALEARSRAAMARRRSARGERLPVLDLSADLGELGPSVDQTRTTRGAAARLRVPIFDGGRARGEQLRADAELRAVDARLASLRESIEVEVRTALLDAEAAEAGIELALSATELAGRQLEQARNRFAAGVGPHLEVVEAQEAVALAAEREVLALWTQRLAKGSLARAIGMDEHAILAVLANDVQPLTRGSLLRAGEENRVNGEEEDRP